ncbi:MAG: hypothetical protein N4J56_006112 [Chroococcidiopsis sp. SAG 2025]|uniref:hypothetical protein n=1 Tax=Chroococcidiopsis sp. SAG 2025 TaxID=171389 RepID=UPI00293721B3|nr:hypothetical protein [Chroococcidiopsis sp. SAG 2025]MDV2996458.1 hypothetical protein [Chroococcidiopsis sp. SAG 2025]
MQISNAANFNELLLKNLTLGFYIGKSRNTSNLVRLLLNNSTEIQDAIGRKTET